MRNEIASSVETAEWSFTGIRTRLRRRLPDHKDAGMGTRLSDTNANPNLVLLAHAARGTNPDLFCFERLLGRWCGAVCLRSSLGASSRPVSGPNSRSRSQAAR